MDSKQQTMDEPRLQGLLKVLRANEEVSDMSRTFWNQMVRQIQVSSVVPRENCGFAIKFL
jgi:hypothetical protein